MSLRGYFACPLGDVSYFDGLAAKRPNISNAKSTFGGSHPEDSCFKGNDFSGHLQLFFKLVPYMFEPKTPQVPARGIRVPVSQNGLDDSEAVNFTVKNAGDKVTDPMKGKMFGRTAFHLAFHASEAITQ
jgi:hypothetical protein